jgi:hypothetical protein
MPIGLFGTFDRRVLGRSIGGLIRATTVTPDDER